MKKIVSNSIILGVLAFTVCASSWGVAETEQVHSMSEGAVFEIQGKAIIV
ncbi:hypothetical protein MM221_06025 [Salipaludibacillus sp. LMS25]|jgi:hypothetical protein|nr:hypothetical protein [Salipaludibacillus sp. LMS25]UTR16115.1 hypothetical protein MM221_06025 [Salipaludibacillus sp. LMS25]